MIIRTVSDLLEWTSGARDQFGDPSRPVCSLIFRWTDDIVEFDSDADDLLCGSDALFCGMELGQMFLCFGEERMPIPIVEGDCKIHPDGSMACFGAEQIAAGVWVLNPSLNLPGVLHGFVTLCGVPSPPPWEKKLSRSRMLEVVRVAHSLVLH